MPAVARRYCILHVTDLEMLAFVFGLCRQRHRPLLASLRNQFLSNNLVWNW
jgi:hypothetical protein